MIQATSQAIYDCLTKHDIQCSIEDRETFSVVHLGVSVPSTNYRVQYISPQEPACVDMRIFNLVKFPRDKMAEMTEAANDCNTKFRFLRFIVDADELSVNLDYNFPAECKDIGEAAMEILQRSAEIVEKCYPELMKVISG
ncbi:MAG TPA: hypothetical protein DCG49_10935 [Ruminococcus sp.]|nr:hypothetical protein [Ruminococcus sp.]